MATTNDLKLFNRGIFDRNDPAEAIGVNLPGFSLYHLYSDIEADKAKDICQEVYSRVLAALKTQTPEHAKSVKIKYADYQHKDEEGPRDYIVVTRETPRGTRATILVRCLSYGNNVYLGIDSYLLGSLDKIALLRRVLYSLVPFAFLLCPLLFVIPSILVSAMAGPFAQQSSLTDSLQPIGICAVPILIFALFFWTDVIRGLSQHGNLVLALRESFNNIPDTETFNLDDVFMFLKSVLPIILFSVRDVFQENGLDIKTLDNFISTVNNINNISQTFNNFAPNAGVQGPVGGTTTVSSRSSTD